jgi:hypothetical protein
VRVNILIKYVWIPLILSGKTIRVRSVQSCYPYVESRK